MDEPASRKRRLLAVYIDYLLFAAIVAPVQWIAQSRGVHLHWAFFIIAFGVLESLLIQRFESSAGYWALGIVRRGDTPVVEPVIKRTERWWTILLGVGLILEGAKQIVRWTEGLPPLPVFGTGADEGAFLVVSAIGAGNIGAGFAILRCRSAGALVGMAVFVAETIAFALSWSRIDEWLVARLSARRALQGRGPVTADDVAAAESIFHATLAIGTLVTAVALIFTYVRFRREPVASR